MGWIHEKRIGWEGRVLEDDAGSNLCLKDFYIFFHIHTYTKEGESVCVRVCACMHVCFTALKSTFSFGKETNN